MRVLGIDFVMNNVTDIARAKRFYKETLGIDSPMLFDSEAYVEFDTHPVALALGVPPEGMGKAPSTSIALAVEDVHAAVEELKAKGVRVLTETVDTGVCTFAYIEDPDGNTIFLHHRHDGTVG